jgi:NAD-dependent SIR2 family protein deacetylase
MANEKRLIDANAMREDWLENGENEHVYDTNAVLDSIDAQPTVDAVEVVHGEWERTEYHGFIRCSKCKDVYIDDSWVADGKWNYCPNCGAKMDGERKDNGKSTSAE